MPEVLSPPQNLIEQKNSTDTLVQELFPGAKVAKSESPLNIDWKGLKADRKKNRGGVRSYTSRRSNKKGETIWEGAEAGYKNNITFATEISNKSRVHKEALSSVDWPTYDSNKELFPVAGKIQEEISRLSEASATSSDYIKLLKKAVLPLYEISYEGDSVDVRAQDADSLSYPPEIRQYLLANVVVPTLEAIEKLDFQGEDLEDILSSLGQVASSSGAMKDVQKQAFSAQVTHTMLKIGGSQAIGPVMSVYKTYYSNDLFSTPEKLSPEHTEASSGYITGTTYDNYVAALHGSVVEQLSMVVDDPVLAVQALGSLIGEGSTGSMHRYIKCLEKIGPEVGMEMLLGKLKSESWLERRMAAEILYNLELGKIGVTGKGAKYLGKLYDLGKYNDPDFFVRRLNNSGLMAVLAEGGGNIEGVFPLDLYSEGDVIQAEVRQLMSQELFLPKADETPEQRKQRERYLKLFLENYESIFNDDFFKDTGVRINSLELHEQGWFLLNYLELTEQENTEELERLKKFVSAYGEYGLKSFLALEYGGSGQEILDFAEATELTKEEKLAIFKNFYGIANEAFGWRKVFGQVETELGYGFAPQVHEAFVRKNAEFFRAAQLIARGNGGDVTVSELLQNMNTISFSMRALKGIYEADSNLSLQQAPQTQDEYDKDGNLVASASSSYILVDEGIGARVVVSIRPQPTIQQGNIAGGEARINFSVTNLATEERARIGFDLSDYGKSVGEPDKLSVVSLDLGVGKPDREAGIRPSRRVGRVLELVEGSEGGHNELSFRPEVAKQFPEIAKRFRDYVEAKFVGQN